MTFSEQERRTEKTYTVDCGDVRADTYIASVTGKSRNNVANLLEAEKILVNGARVRKNYILTAGDVITVFEAPPEKVATKPEDIPIEIVYEDDFVAVVNKPKGMVVHPAAGNQNGTMVNALLYKMSGRLSGINGEERPGIVHRIDKNTSGLLIVAKNDEAHRIVAEQIKEHSFLRRYHAVVCGNLREDEGVINYSVGRSKKDRKKMAAYPPDSDAAGVRNAVTRYRVLERFSGTSTRPAYTYIECTLETGRTHQIRVHFSAVGHPVLGDDTYGGKNNVFPGYEGQCLHAKEIGFIHPVTGKELFFSSELPEYFSDTLHKLRDNEKI